MLVWGDGCEFTEHSDGSERDDFWIWCGSMVVVVEVGHDWGGGGDRDGHGWANP